MNEPTDNDLMLRVQAGDLQAFELLVDRFKSMVYGLAMSMLRRPEDAEEASQDTFLKLFRARSRFDGERKLGPWLLRIAGNACRDRLRRRRVAELPVVRRGDDERDPLHDVADPRFGNGEDHVVPTVRTELDALSRKVREPIELKYLHGFTNSQIADSLGISISNVKVQLSRGKDLLASRLEGLRDGFGRAAPVRGNRGGTEAAGGAS